MNQGKKGTFTEKAVNSMYVKMPFLIQKIITVLAVHLRPLKDHPVGCLYILYLECIAPRIYAKNFKVRRLRKLLRHAYYNVPYYKRLLGNSNLKQLKKLGDVDKLPCLEKGDLKSNFKDFVSISKIKHAVKQTSGSTGKPLKFLADMRIIAWKMMSVWKIKTITGHNFYDMAMWVNQEAYLKSKKPTKGITFAPIQRRLDFYTDIQTEKDFEEFIWFVKKYKIKIVISMPSFMYMIALYLLERNINLRIDCFVSNAETLLSNHAEKIKEAFGCEVYDVYGVREYGFLMYRKHPQRVYSNLSNNFIVEVVDRHGKQVKNGRGCLLLTNLLNYKMPLIRYNVGDIARVHGYYKGEPVIEEITGRTSAFLKIGDKYVTSTFLNVLLDEFEELRNCQFVWDGNILVVNVVSSSADGMLRDNLYKRLNEVLGIRNIIIRHKNKLPREKSGKVEFVKIKNYKL